MNGDLREKVAVPLLVILAFLLQTTVAPHLTFIGVQPDIILIVVIVIALLRGPVIGSVCGFAGGMLKDLVLLQTLGLDALSKTLVGYFAGRFSEDGNFSIFVGMMSVFLGSFFAEMIRLTLSYLLGLGELGFVHSLTASILPFCIYNTLIFPLVFIFTERLLGVEPEFPGIQRGII